MTTPVSAPPMLSTPPVPPTLSASSTDSGTRMFLWSCIVGVSAFFVWATIGTLDIISLAVGEVIPSTQIKSLQHLEGGIVRSVRVREGDRVKAGEELVVLEAVRNESEVKELQARITALEIQALRLRTELATPPDAEAVLEIPESLAQRFPRETGEMRNHFTTRQKRLLEQQAMQRAWIIQREQEFNEARSQTHASQELLKHLAEQIGISEQLLQKDLSNRMKHLELLKESTRLKGVIAEAEARQKRLQGALLEGTQRLSTIHTTFLEEAGKELTMVTGTLQELTQRRDKLDDALRRTVLKAPVDGVIKTIHVHTIGEVVMPGGSLLELVPSNDLLVIQAQLPIQEIGFVVAGQTAIIRLDSMGSSGFDTLIGTVIHVSPDSLVDKKGMPYYLARIQTDRDHFTSQDGLHHPLLPGMRVQCAIVTGTRTILAYLFGPWFASMDNALRER
ncbi:MAG: HlyD family type I secretion periplasmic adaptor subunit [Magnetococcales bacterium]|nr:HlyD family type I secretion periplasmic adaptor subunit [Magnetococcales bacterium]